MNSESLKSSSKNHYRGNSGLIGIPPTLQLYGIQLVVSHVRVHYFEWNGLQIKREKHLLHSKTGPARILLGQKSPKQYTTSFIIISFIDATFYCRTVKIRMKKR